MRTLLILLALVVAFGAGMYFQFATKSVAPIKRNVRQALGLSKDWRVLPGPERIGDQQPVACPAPGTALVVVTGGQSNAANTNSSMTATAPEDGVYTFFEGACYVTRDPVLGATGTEGSLWPDFGRALAAATGRPVLFIHGAVGGTEVGDWLDERSGYLAALTGRIAAARAQGHEPDWILWLQGETDANTTPDAEMFRARYTALTERLLEAAPAARLYLFRNSRCGGPRRLKGVEMITRVQGEVADANPRIVKGMFTDALADDHRRDQCHFNSTGRAAIVAEVVPEIAALTAPAPAAE